MHDGGVAADGNRERLTAGARLVGPPERFVERRRRAIDVAEPQSPLDALAVDLDEETDAPVQSDGERLGAAHAAESGGEHEPPGQGAAEVLARAGGEGL